MFVLAMRVFYSRDDGVILLPTKVNTKKWFKKKTKVNTIFLK